MAGKIDVGTKRGEKDGGTEIPTAKWEVQHQARPESAGATTAGMQLHQALQKSKGTGLKVP